MFKTARLIKREVSYNTCIQLHCTALSYNRRYNRRLRPPEFFFFNCSVIVVNGAKPNKITPAFETAITTKNKHFELTISDNIKTSHRALRYNGAIDD